MPQMRFLLEHQQGHFDAMQIEALKWQHDMLRSIKENKSVFRAHSEEDAKQLLKQMLDDELASRLKEARAAEGAYDNLRSHADRQNIVNFRSAITDTFPAKVILADVIVPMTINSVAMVISDTVLQAVKDNSMINVP